jgi:hypothetical protein
MPKQRTGYVYFDKQRKTWTARLTYKDELGPALKNEPARNR